MAWPFESYRASPRRLTGTPGHLSRRTPSNPKYDGVTSRLNTGMTVAKLNKRYAGTGGPNAHRRPTNQYFAKLKPTTLAKLVEPKMEAEESIYKVEKDDAVSTVTTMVDAMQMSDDAIKNAEVMILDCRPFEDYHACRVHGAYHYDIAQLGKATNQFPRELYFFKAPIESNKMIVIYDSGRDVEATRGGLRDMRRYPRARRHRLHGVFAVDIRVAREADRAS